MRQGGGRVGRERGGSEGDWGKVVDSEGESEGEERGGVVRRGREECGREERGAYLHTPPCTSYTPTYPQIPSYILIYLKIPNIRNMKANMGPKNRHISGLRAFPKVIISHNAS